MKVLLIILELLAIILAHVIPADAGPKERVSVAYSLQRARIDIKPGIPADDFSSKRAQPQPTLLTPEPDDNPVSAITDLEQALTANTVLMNDQQRVSAQLWRSIQDLDLARKEVATKQEKITEQAYTIAELKIAQASVAIPQSHAASAVVPMSMSIPKGTVAVSEAMPAQLVIGSWESGCPNCVRLKDAIRVKLIPLGWKVGYAATDHIQFVTIPQSQSAPQITLYQNGAQIRTWSGYQDPSELSQALRQAWDSAPSRSQSIQASGVAGTIHAAPQIKQVIEFFRQNIGEGVKTEMRWDRSGAQSFPLLAKGDWSAQALFGKYGHMELKAKGARNLPIDALGFGYKVEGDDVTIDGDPLVLKGLAKLLGPSQSESVGAAAQPSKFVGMSLLSVLMIIRDIWLLCHPSMDLQMGGCVSASAMLNGDTLAIDFDQMPSVKLVALFTFQLGIKRLEIAVESVRAMFSGSMIVKERTFPVD